MEQQGKITVIFGPNGSGKTQYAERMRRQLASDRVRYLAFSDAYGPATDKTYYLQLRWNQHDIDEETPCVGDLLQRAYQQSGEDTPEHRQLRDNLYESFGMKPLLDKYIILLSSGELRKFQLIKTLLANPKILILDNPFIGLDAETRQQLNDLMVKLKEEQGISLYLLIAKSDDIPASADEVIRMEEEAEKAPHSAELSDKNSFLTAISDLSAIKPSDAPTPSVSETVIKMQDVSVRYGERTILSHLDWTVKKGERWALSGQNGSGKSTLLSLVCADNPQSYACDIALFGQQRGCGETIWDIKRRIGYVSPEMHRSYLRNIPTLKVVASGIKDTVGLYVRTNAEETEMCRRWMQVFGIAHLADRSFITLSSGEQRLALVARAFVKNPELLILDEPFHGLDDANRQRVRDVIEAFCQHPEKTLIMVTHYENEYPQCINKHLYLQHQ
jgi:molybdate transport system ATP-binding protein